MKSFFQKKTYPEVARMRVAERSEAIISLSRVVFVLVFLLLVLQIALRRILPLSVDHQLTCLHLHVIFFRARMLILMQRGWLIPFLLMQNYFLYGDLPLYVILTCLYFRVCT